MRAKGIREIILGRARGHEKGAGSSRGRYVKKDENYFPFCLHGVFRFLSRRVVVPTFEHKSLGTHVFCKSFSQVCYFDLFSPQHFPNFNKGLLKSNIIKKRKIYYETLVALVYDSWQGCFESL